MAVFGVHLNVLVIAAALFCTFGLYPDRLVAAQDEADSQTSGSTVSSCSGGDVLLSNNRSLAPLEIVEASDSLPHMLPAQVYDSPFTWCTMDNDSNPYIDMWLTSPVLVSKMVTGGTVLVEYDGNLGVYYVTNFTLEYSPPDDPSLLNFYSLSGERVFFESPDFNTLIQFERPFLTRRIRLRPVEWYSSDGNYSEPYICQGVAIYGCLQSQVIESGTAAASRDRSLDIVLPIMFIALATLTLVIVVLSVLLIRTQSNGNDKHRKPVARWSLRRMVSSSASVSNMDSSTPTTPTTSTTAAGTKEVSSLKKVPAYGRENSLHELKPNTGNEQPSASRLSEFVYEPMDPENVPGSLVQVQNPRRSELERDNAEAIESDYEPIDIEKRKSAAKLVLVSDSSTPRPDSFLDMTDNLSYGQESFLGSEAPMVPSEPLEDDEKSQYEEIIAQNRDSCYDYVAMAPSPATHGFNVEDEVYVN